MYAQKSSKIRNDTKHECSCKHAKNCDCEINPDEHVPLQNKQFSFGRRRQRFCGNQSFHDMHQSSYQSEIFMNSQDPSVIDKKPQNYFKKQACSSKNRNSRQKVREASDFRYGNYHQYYGYRNQGSIDSRILCMRKEWFHLKDVLDIGCNAGHFTLSIARDFEPKSIVGIDIDSDLIKIAKRNVKHYVNCDVLSDNDFPVSLALNYGPIAQSLDPKYRYSVGRFPFNVQFIQGNYILPSDEILQWQESFFDTVLCLSLTKWIHLNWGDEGIKRLFHRAFAHLNPGGCLLLEAQSFQSYSKKRKITDEIFKHYKEIEFFPEKFNEFLLNEVGFQSCELVDTPAHSSKGFSRPIYLFIKGAGESVLRKTPKHIFYNSDSDNSCNYSDIEQLSD